MTSYSISEEALRHAIDSHAFELYYQPKVCLLRGTVTGAEALIRWPLPNGELVQPDDFIPLATSLSWLGEITTNMLAKAISAIETLNLQFNGLSISMNVAPTDLEQQQLTRQIEACLASNRIQPAALQIEITESIAMNDFERVYMDLVNLNEMGVRVLMDDFGTGYSSIDRLSRLPFAALKLDKGMVQRMGLSRHNLDVVKASISMAREMRMTSVAEGVENEGAYNFLIANGCEEAQGYWISQALTLDDFIDFVSRAPVYEGSQIGRVHQAQLNIQHYRKSLIDATYCWNLSPDSVLSSVVEPEVGFEAADSRFGLWYYGIGQRLQALASFRELEPLFLALHVCGQQFMEEFHRGAPPDTINRMIIELDQHVDALSAMLRRLERELLMSTST